MRNSPPGQNQGQGKSGVIIDFPLRNADDIQILMVSASLGFKILLRRVNRGLRGFFPAAGQADFFADSSPKPFKIKPVLRPVLF